MPKIRAEITPPHLRCGAGTCPGVYRLEDGNLLIIGKRVDQEIEREIKAKIGDDELAVVIDPAFFEKFLK